MIASNVVHTSSINGRNSSRVWLAHSSTLVLLLGCLLAVATALDKVDDRRRLLLDSGGPVTAIISFGDSTLDTGNNNFFANLGKSDFPPYGRDFPGGVPTGRFCNGKLTQDYIADAMGLPYGLPYLDPNATGDAIITGINFASSGSGWNVETSIILNVQTFPTQIEWFKGYKNKLFSLVGEENGTTIIRDALYFVSTGANDFIDRYLVGTNLNDTPAELQANLLGNAQQHLQLPIHTLSGRLSIGVEHLDANSHKLELWNLSHKQEIYDLGARRIGVSGVPAIGCLPLQITIHGNGSTDCVQFFNDLSVQFNTQLKALLQQINNDMPGATLFYIDSYTPLLDAFNNPAKYGFIETRRACCGSGYLEAGILCNEYTTGTCADAYPYLFWDGFHPTTHFYEILANSIMYSGDYPFVP